jgi:hypothetical protein
MWLPKFREKLAQHTPKENDFDDHNKDPSFWQWFTVTILQTGFELFDIVNIHDVSNGWVVDHASVAIWSSDENLCSHLRHPYLLGRKCDPTI